MFNHLVKNKQLIISLLFLLVASLFLSSGTVFSAHAQLTGLVCITASSTATSCDASPPMLGPIKAGAVFSVGVFIQSSDAMAGFDIYVKSDPAYVTPVHASLGNLIAHPTLEAMCLNNRTTVSCIGGGANGQGVVEVAAVESSGSNECGGVSPCSGIAFTISYEANIVAPVSSTPISYPTDPGCSTSSVSSPPNTCVLVNSAIGTVLAQNIQGATVNTEPSGFTGLVCVTYPPTDTSCPSTPATIGPVSVGSTFTIGVLMQGSQAMSGFDIYVKSDPSVLNPVSAALGPLIANPVLTIVCVDGVSVTGSCTVGTANGPGVVEVSSLDATDSNECFGLSPCSGVAFTITYQVLGSTFGTSLSYPTATGCIPSQSSVFSPPNTCVLVADNGGNVLAENVQGAIVRSTQEFVANAILSSNTIPQGASVPFAINFGHQFSSIQSVCFDFTFTQDLLDPGDWLSIYSDQFLPYGTSGGFGFINISNLPEAQRTLCLPRQDFDFVDAFLSGNLVGTIQMVHGSVTIASLAIRITGSAPELKISKFFTDSSFNPLPLDTHGNPMVNVVMNRGMVRSTNPGQVLAWVNVTNTASTPLQSLRLNDTLPVDWVVHPAWIPAKGGIHVYYETTTSLASNPDITQPKAITVTNDNPQTVTLTITNLNATGIGHPLFPGESILLSVQLEYGLRQTAQSLVSYPRNYTDTASVAAWSQSSFAGNTQSGIGSASFTAYASVKETEPITIGQFESRIIVGTGTWLL